jgi:hypothetical protein
VSKKFFKRSVPNSFFGFLKAFFGSCDRIVGRALKNCQLLKEILAEKKVLKTQRF